MRVTNGRLSSSPLSRYNPPMFDTLLPTKLYMPPNRAEQVGRPHLLAKLAGQPQTRLLLLSAPAGYGKTTLLTSWLRQQTDKTVCWVSLDGDDSNPTQFFAYLALAIRPLPNAQSSLRQLLQANQPLPATAFAKTFVQDITPVTTPFILVLDDYHRLDAPAIDEAVAFLLQYMPPQMQVVIATREDPPLPLARLRARHQLVELRGHDLRFSQMEATRFLREVMGLRLTTADITALESRTEGWIAGLQLAALALQGQADTELFIASFSGSHRFVLDYLVEEVLQQQPEAVQTFLLQTAVLDRLCAPLCDAVLANPAISGQETLAHLEQANLFLIPLDGQRRWYRYHHLFADLLRQRLQQQGEQVITRLHLRASKWYEANELEIEAFHHATAAHDIDRAEYLIDAKGPSLQFRGGAVPILHWLRSLETAVFQTRPSLLITYASTLLAVSQLATIEEKVQAAEKMLPDTAQDVETRDLIGRIASIRATVGVATHQAETIITQAHRALAYLDPNNVGGRASISWNLGYAYLLQGDRAAAGRAYAEAQAKAVAIGHQIIAMMSTLGVGSIQEGDNQLQQAAQTYQHLLQAVGEPPPLPMCEAYLGLARIHHEWNALDAAQRYWEQNAPLARQFGSRIDRSVMSDLFLARLKLAQGEVDEAAAIVAQAAQTARQHRFEMQIGEAVALQVAVLLRRGGKGETAVSLAQNDPLTLARVHLAQGNAAAALNLLKPLRQETETKGWHDKRLKVLVLQALAHEALGEADEAAHHLATALALGEPQNFVRTFLDEGQPMAALLTRIQQAAALSESLQQYAATLLAAFTPQTAAQPLVDPLSDRELEVLHLIAQGLSNREIATRLFLAIDTVKGHNRRIFDKLGVRRRTEAVAQARELGLL